MLHYSSRRYLCQNAEFDQSCYKEFYVLVAVRATADSRGAFTPSNVHWKFSVRLYRFMLLLSQILAKIVDLYGEGDAFI